jgi:hypothetical protein
MNNYDKDGALGPYNKIFQDSMGVSRTNDDSTQLSQRFVLTLRKLKQFHTETRTLLRPTELKIVWCVNGDLFHGLVIHSIFFVILSIYLK